MIIFLASWGMLFAALFFSYFLLRARAPVWPPDGWRLPLAMPTVNTVVMLLSSVTLGIGLHDVRSGFGHRLTAWLIATVLLGLAFLALQNVVWQSVWREGLHVDTSLYGSVFYALTVFHALHVLAGIGVLLWLLRGAFRGAYNPARYGQLQTGSMFWHFVGVVWMAMFLTVYVI